MRKIYLDYAASTPLDPRVKRAMEPYCAEKFGNPSSIHSFGQEALAAVDTSREIIAKACGVGFRDVVFTASATEANNLAIRGIARSIKYLVSSIKYPRIVTTAIEHESILETCRDLENEGVDVVYLPVDRNGIVHLEKLKKALNKNTVLVSIGYANNEIGTIQPITEIAKIIRNWKLEIGNSASTLPLLHVDAVQAFQYLNSSLPELGVDLMTFSAQKIYGPKGIGALIMRNSKHEARNPKQIRNSNQKNSKHVSDFDIRYPDLPTVIPLVTGGGQEFGLRSGTENVPAIVGFAKAVEIVVAMRAKESKRVQTVRDYFEKRLRRVVPGAAFERSAAPRAPHISNVAFPDISSEQLVVALDLAGVAVSAGSACAMRSLEPSHVLKAIGVSEGVLKSSIRISLGRGTTKQEIDIALNCLIRILKTRRNS